MNQLTQQIAGAYIGAQVSGLYKATAADIMQSNIIGMFRLILTPLSAISDDDAVEVARMAIGDSDNDTHYKYIPNDKPEKYGLLNIHPDVSVVGVERFINHPDYMQWSPMYLIQIDHDEFDITKGFYSGDDEYSDEIPENIQHIIDYLRSRNYDLGYMGIRSLIDADIAISSTDKTETK